MLAKVISSALVGLDATPVEVEVDIASYGLPSFTIVGLPDKAVEESKERVRSAIRNCGADFPPRKITVNLAPADLPKEGPSYDLPIAIGILIASGQITADISHSLFIGELSLDGKLRPVNGILSHVLMGKSREVKQIFLPLENSNEAAIISDITIFGISSLSQLIHHLSGIHLISPTVQRDISFYFKEENYEFDMKDVKGQEKAKRAFEIAAAGSHNILLKGPPGAGKTLLAKTLPSILPQMTFQESLETTKIYSIAGYLQKEAIVTKRPFRNPHHTTSHVGLIGGTQNPKPGEVSLAHRGVLFLDEFAEFPKHALEVLRQPLEDGNVTISRANGRVTFPSKFMLVAAQNPCPCGYFGDSTTRCKCNTTQILRYQKKISGPLLDRIDIHLEVPAVKTDKLTDFKDSEAESSSSIRSRVQKARDIQADRFKKTTIVSNSEMSSREVRTFCELSDECIQLLKNAIQKFNLSARSYHRIIKLSRTIADLECSNYIKPSHLAEALQYRPRLETL